MPLTSSDRDDASTDTRILTSLILELNIARRNYRSYPKGHPVINSSLHKVIGIYDRLMQFREEVVLGAAHDSLMVDGVMQDKSNPVYRDLARSLFEHGIAVLTLRPGLTVGELSKFTVILGLKRDELTAHGGIEKIWSAAAITSLMIQPVRYDMFTTSDGIDTGSSPAAEPAGLWERFSRAISRQQHLPAPSAADQDMDPVQMANIINRQFAENRSTAESVAGYAAAISGLMDSHDTSAPAAAGYDFQCRQLALFVSSLTPELRRQFLSSSFNAARNGDLNGIENIVSALPHEVIIDTLQDVSNNRLTVPPVVMGLLQRLGQNSAAPHHAVDDDPICHEELDELGSKMKTLFREQASEEFVPEVYQAKLDRLVTTGSIPSLATEDIGSLLATLAPKCIDIRISEILLQLVIADSDSSDTNILTENLNEMCSYFLETGDYDQLMKVIARSREERFPESVRESMRSYFSRREFMDEVLNGLHVWGKSRYEQIRMVIHEIGESFIEVLLDVLAEENNMSLRRFLMDRLLEFGPAARPAILARLSDGRWYVLRNLVIMLRSMNDPGILASLRRLIGHPNPRLRQEVLRTFLLYNDPAVEHQLLHDLDSSDREIQLAAVHLSEKSKSHPVFNKLMSIVTRSGFSAHELDLRVAAVHALAGIGRMEALPELIKLLGSKSLFHGKQLARLKTEIIHSLEHYPDRLSRPVLDKLAHGADEVARQAAEILRGMNARKP